MPGKNSGKRPPVRRIPIKKGGSSHDFLSAAKSVCGYREFITADDIMHILGKFPGIYEVRTTAKQLIKCGYIEEVGVDSWRITRQGELDLYELADRTTRIRSR